MITVQDRHQQQLTLPGLVCKDHHFDVPVDYSNAETGNIRIFAREVVSPDKVDRAEQLPWLVWFSGGPGFQAPRPESASGWLKRALKDYKVLLLDQRGTGLSSPVTHESLSNLKGAQAQADYLKHFRADNIVRDAEFIRQKLAAGKKWSILGQSYGGFCCTSYLSLAPHGLSEAFITGGIPPCVNQPDLVYRATYQQAIKKNLEFYRLFPQDVEIVHAIVEHLRTTEVFLPTGEQLTVNRFLQLGHIFGFKDAGHSMVTLHYLLERAFVDERRKQLSYYFLRHIEMLLDYNTNPIYSLLHEAIYCHKKASRWSAERIMEEFPQYHSQGSPVFFIGEMIFSWMFDDYQCLRTLKNAAAILAEFENWPDLYDLSVLKQNKVKCAAVVYVDDMYVDFALSQAMAENISGIKLWVTNEYEHDGIRVDGERVLDRLISLLRGVG